MMKPIKVLIAKTGLDGHDRGAKVVARALSESGMEVIYTGLRQTPEKIVQAALEEDVDVIGLSSLSGAHEYFFSEVARLLKEKELEHILLLGGGIIPKEDILSLKAEGVDEIFTSGTPTGEIISYIKENVAGD